LIRDRFWLDFINTLHRVRGCRELALTFAIGIVSQGGVISLSDYCTYHKLLMSHVSVEAADDDALVAALQQAVDQKKEEVEKKKEELAAAEQAE
jgi:hypothetical protein